MMCLGTVVILLVLELIELLCGFKAFIISGKISASNYEFLFSILLSLTSCWIPSTYILVFLKLFQSSVMDNYFFPTFFPLLFSMYLFNIHNTLQPHEYKDYYCSTQFNVLPY